MKSTTGLTALFTTLFLALPAAAQATMHQPAQAAAPAQGLTEGEVRKVDKDAKKITIRHGAITHLDMPPMTMVFRVQDPGMLDQVKTGERIRFRADKVGGAYTITALEAAQ